MTIHHQRVRHLSWSLAILSIATAAIFVSGAISQPNANAANSSVEPVSAPAQGQALEHANTLSKAFRSAADQVLPSVVMIQTTSVERAHATMKGPNGQEIPEELLQNPQFRRFFREMPGSPNGEQDHPRSGMGSGVIIDPSGIILTNNHVVAGSGRVTVRLHDGREFTATDVQTDPKSDLAVIRIEGAGDLPAAQIGDSDAVQIGDWVIAAGAPFGLRESVTAGIISAKARGIGMTEREEFLQTDAAINPGNSGGPLVSLDGKVVGINTAISSTSGGYQGIGFAVPINLAKWVADQLISGSGVQRAFLGVGIQEMTMPVAQQLGLSEVNGALINEVRPDSPAGKAGLQSGDVIVEFDGMPIGTPRKLQGIVERADVNVEHSLVIVRDGQRMTLTAQVGSMPAELANTGNQANDPKSPLSRLGIEVDALTADVAEKLGYHEADGVLVTNVEPGSIADQAGIEEGMLIARIGKSSVKSVDDFQQALDEHPLDDELLVLVRSAKGSRYVVLSEK